MEHRRDEEFDIIVYGDRNRQKSAGNPKRKGQPQRQSLAKGKPQRAVQEKNRERQGSTGTSRAREIRRKKRRRKVFIARFVCAFFICFLVGIAALGIYRILFGKKDTGAEVGSFSMGIGQWFGKGTDWTEEEMLDMLEQEGIVCTQDFLTVNEYSRPAEELKKVRNIFVHYTANPETSAAQNRSYFENLSETHETSASAHFIIGYEGEIVQCIPLGEIAYAVAGRNRDSVSIECCYVDESGQFTTETYDTLVKLSALLLEKYGLDAGDLRRHYDEGGKLCPKYYVENEEEWQRFVEDVKVKLQSTEK